MPRACWLRKRLKSRGIALGVLGQYAAGNAELDRSLHLRRDVPTLLVRAKFAGLQNDPILARQLIDEALKDDPNDEDAFAMSVSLMRQRGESQKALAAIDEFLKRNKTSIAARTARIEVLFSLNDEAGAKKDVEAILKQAPGSLVGFYYRAVIAARDKNYKEAWAQAQKLPPGFVQYQPNIAMEVAQIAIASGNPESGAGFLLRSSLATLKFNRHACSFRQFSCVRNGPKRRSDTLEPLKNSDTPQVQAMFAQAYLQLRRYVDATAALRKATASSGFASNELLRTQLAFSEIASGNPEEGVQTLQQLATHDPGNPEIAGQLSLALMREGKLDDALATVDRFAKAQPKVRYRFFIAV